MKVKYIVFLVLHLAVVWCLLSAREVKADTSGFKYFKNYTRKDYDGQSQNWAVAQDPRGIIYAANHGALLEFDGVSWREFQVPNNTVRSLAIENTGTIYIGGKDEIGFFTRGTNGNLTYVSLVEHIDAGRKKFSDVWSTHSTKEGIYFETGKFLFRWWAGRLKVWEIGTSIKSTFYCRGTFYVQQAGAGLFRVENELLHLVPGGEAFSEKGIFMMTPLEPTGAAAQKLLIGVKSEGFYIYDGKTAVPFPTEADEFLIKNRVYYGIRLSSGELALATRLGGLAVLDAHGRLKHIFDKTSGLQSENVKYVFEDNQGNLWLALGEGVSRIEYRSPFTFYDSRCDLPGFPLSAAMFQKGIYTGTTTGLYYLAPTVFRPIPGPAGGCWALLSTADSLLAAADNGVFQIKKDNKSNDHNITRKIPGKRCFVLIRSGTEPNRIWVGTDSGVISLSSTEGRWTEEYRLQNITQAIRTIAEDKTGNLWLGTLTGGVIRAGFPAGPANPVVTGYGTDHGLPAGEVNVFYAAAHVMFATAKGIYRFDEAGNRFIPDLTLGKDFAGGSNGVFRIAEDSKKNIWFHSKSRNYRAISRAGGTYTIRSTPFLRLPLAQVNGIYPEPSGDAVWFSGFDGLVRYSTTTRKNYRHEYTTFIRDVLVNGKPFLPGSSLPVLDYKDRNFRFRYAAPFFEDETGTRYRCFLEGYDSGWSDWTAETQKDYTNLDSGFYTFRVQAANVYKHLSKEGIFQFKVLPPWYKTWWAVLLYCVLFFLLMYFYGKRRSAKLEREKQRLQRIVAERTTEIHEKNRQLEEQAGKLKEMDRIKSRFFANISHEFRTPLTLIMGPLEQMSASPGSKEQEANIDMALRNSQRLLDLINQLLDLSKLESGKMKLQAAPQNIVPFLRSIVASFDSVMIRKELVLSFHASEENLTIYFDPEKIERAVCNLLSNAIKFTPAGGTITVSVTGHPGKSGRFASGYVEITVCDTGIGIPASQLPYIFDRFFQVGTHEHVSKGTGIGLALAKELVTVHHGEIDVQSREGQDSGTCFIVRLPMGEAHLVPGEITALPDSLPAPPGKTGHRDFSALYAIEVAGEETAEQKEAEKKEETAADNENLILVVEDNADVRRYIRSSLEPLFTVEEAVDGREGIKKALDIIPDLIISDVMMPGIDGCELCRQLKTDIHTSHIPIILLTAKAAEESVIQGLETGADDYIIKPFNTKILMARIKNLIDLRRQLQLKRRRQMSLQPAEIAVSSIDETFYKELLTSIEKNLDDPEFNVEQMSKKLYMGRTSLYRKIMALTGETPTHFIRSYRLKRGAQLLKANFGNVTDVAFAVGFSSTAYFTRCFKEHFHQLPSAYQASESH